MNRLPKYIEMLNFIEIELDKVRVTTSESEIKAAATLLVTTIDHAQGIMFLLGRTAYPSASSLVLTSLINFIKHKKCFACWLSGTSSLGGTRSNLLSCFIFILRGRTIMGYRSLSNS